MGLGLGLGEVVVPAAALGADEVDQVLLVLGVVDLRDHAQVGLAARGERADEELVVRAEADARLVRVRDRVRVRARVRVKVKVRIRARVKVKARVRARVQVS